MIKSKNIFLYLLLLTIIFVNSKLSIKEEDESINNNIIHNKFLEKKSENEIFDNKNNENKFLSYGITFEWIDLKNLSKFTYFHLILSFLIIPIFSIILIIFDIREDKKLRKEMSLSSNSKVKNEYNSFKNTFIIRAKYLFSWFLFKYHYPLANIFCIYHYNHPRYIRLIIYLITILFNTLISTVLYVLASKSLQNYRFNFWLSLFFSFIVSIIMDLILNFTLKLIFEFHQVRREIFKKKLEILRKYIYYIVKKDILFNSKWHLIRNRMITYYRLCGPFLLKQVKKNKYQKYVKNKNKNSNNDFLLFKPEQEMSFNDCSSLTFDNDNNKTQLLKDTEDIKTNLIDKKIPKRKKSISSFSKMEESKKEIIIEKMNDKVRKNIFKISKGVEPFSFSKFGVNNMKLKTLKKIEEIKNRYINKKKDIKFDETMELDKDIKIFENLEVESLEGFTYISTDAMIDKLNTIKSNSNMMVLNILTGIILIIILFLINLAFMIIQMGEDFNKNLDIQNVFAIIFAEIFIINFIIHRLICLFIALSIHNFYGKKKRNCCYQLIFDIYYEKYIRYLYRIRLLITKYQKEFNFIQK